MKHLKIEADKEGVGSVTHQNGLNFYKKIIFKNVDYYTPKIYFVGVYWNHILDRDRPKVVKMVQVAPLLTLGIER